MLTYETRYHLAAESVPCVPSNETDLFQQVFVPIFALFTTVLPSYSFIEKHCGFIDSSVAPSLSYTLSEKEVDSRRSESGRYLYRESTLPINVAVAASVNASDAPKLMLSKMTRKELKMIRRNDFILFPPYVLVMMLAPRQGPYGNDYRHNIPNYQRVHSSHGGPRSFHKDRRIKRSCQVFSQKGLQTLA